MNEMKKTCTSCCFSHLAFHLECRRYPPSTCDIRDSRTGAILSPDFPIVKEDTWCGEHAKKSLKETSNTDEVMDAFIRIGER